jgi:phenylalanyl-tRNA synthetase beta chain
MLISYSWLKDYVDVKLPAEKLADLFTMSGLSAASIKKTASDQIIEIEVTSNRPDWLSYVGVARELAAITGEKLKMPAAPELRVQGPGSRVQVKIEDKKLCPRYTARVIKNVKVAPSPVWLKTKIEAMGLRPVNNIVDITNLCLFETGEPMHAFDLDKLKGPEIIVRKAKGGEKIVAIDGAEKALDESILVIADKERPVAIAGVMGGADTEVSDSTKNILLEAASFDPISIRRTSRKLAIATESSYRFERKVDMENIIYSSDRAASLILEIAGGEPGELVDVGDKAPAKKTVSLRCSKLNKVLGIEIPQADVKNILNALGLGVKTSSSDKIELEIPNLRGDLENEIDLIEEVARIYGYDKIPVALPGIVEQPIRRPVEDIIEDKTRSILTGLGLDEILTYSLLSKKLVEVEGISGDDTVEVMNPLSSEQEVMRPSLIPGLLNSMLWNINRKAKDLKLFEIGSTYHKDGDDKFAEKITLSVGIMGQASPGAIGASRLCDFYDLKGILETLFRELGINSFAIKDTNDARFSASSRASIEIDGKIVGVMGDVSSRTLASFDIKDKACAALIDLAELFKHAVLEKRFKELPKYPSVSRDISVIAGKESTNDLIIDTIKKTAGAILKDVRLIDRYVGKQIPEGKASLTYRLEYQDPKKTLEDKDILDVHSKVTHALEAKLGAKHR